MQTCLQGEPWTRQVKDRFGQRKVPRRTHRKKFRKSLEHPQQDRMGPEERIALHRKYSTGCKHLYPPFQGSLSVHLGILVP